MRSRCFTIGLVLSFLCVTAQPVGAHSDISEEVTAGNYSVVLSYFGDAAFTDEKIGFDVFSYPLPNGNEETPTSGKVIIAKESGEQIFSGELDVADMGAPGYFSHTFAEVGYHVITISLVMGETQLPDAVFRLYVYENPANATASTEQSPSQQEVGESSRSATESNGGTNYVVISILSLALVVAGVFLWKGESILQRIKRWH
jgi:hypothetical protein